MFEVLVSLSFDIAAADSHHGTPAVVLIMYDTAPKAKLNCLLPKNPSVSRHIHRRPLCRSIMLMDILSVVKTMQILKEAQNQSLNHRNRKGCDLDA